MAGKTIKIADIGEFGLIDYIRRTFKETDPDVGIGIGDDAALLRYVSGEILVTTDSLVEGIHFRRDIISAECLGYRALAVNLSDIAAMGGRPRHFFLSLSLPAETGFDFLKGFLSGLRGCSRKFGVVLAGGNITGATEGISITITLIGTPPKRGAVKRSGARPGDGIIVAGCVGDAAAGLFLLTKRPELARRFPLLVNKYRHPEPMVNIGMLLAGRGLVSAMIDISDGLLQDLSHIADASGSGYELDAARIPVSAELVRFSKVVGLDTLDFALNGGEDYSLLLTCSVNWSGEILDIIRRSGLVGNVIGTMKKGKRRLLKRDGKSTGEIPAGFRHF